MAAMEKAWLEPVLEQDQQDVIGEFCRAMNSQSFYIASHYFSQNIVLDFFGRTICGRENVLHFLFDEMRLSNHNIVEIKKGNVLDNHRALGRFRQASMQDKEDCDFLDDSGFFSGNYDANSSIEVDSPCSKLSRGFSDLQVANEEEEHPMQTSSPIFRTPLPSRPFAPHPLKRPSMAVKMLKLIDVPQNLQYTSAAGILSFSNEDCMQGGPAKVYTRPCHMQIGYTYDESLCISMLVYNMDMPCRRNLSQIFDSFE